MPDGLRPRALAVVAGYLATVAAVSAAVGMGWAALVAVVLGAALLTV